MSPRHVNDDGNRRSNAWAEADQVKRSGPGCTIPLLILSILAGLGYGVWISQ